MAVQSRLNQTNYNIILSGITLNKDDAVMLQDAGRSADLVRGTVMAQITATGKWVPLDDIALTTGAGVARGIYMGDDVLAATLVAGDVTGRLMLVGGAAATLSSDEVVFENSLTAATIVAVGTLAVRTIADDLRAIGLFLEDTIAIEEFENA